MPRTKVEDLPARELAKRFGPSTKGREHLRDLDDALVVGEESAPRIGEDDKPCGDVDVALARSAAAQVPSSHLPEALLHPNILCGGERVVDGQSDGRHVTRRRLCCRSRSRASKCPP